MGALLQFTTNVEYRCDCYTCGTPIFMADSVYRRTWDKRDSFYCVNGHSQSWRGKSELEKTKEALEFEKNRRASAERDRETARKAEAIARGKLRAQSERVANGVCPCCNRTFQNLMRHMATKHPEFKSEAT